MKPSGYLFISFLLLIAGHHEASADAPESMILQYNVDTQSLSVEVYHATRKRYDHYINRYEVQVNSGTLATFYQQGQDSTGVALKSMSVRAKAGDTVEVTAYCNQEGFIKGTLYLTEKYATEDKSAYKSVVERSDYDVKRHHFKYVDAYGRPYHHHRGRHHDHDEEDPEEEILVPETSIPKAKQHQLDVEEEINRKAFEAKFGPLKAPADKTQK